MGAVEDPGSAGGGGEQRAGEGTERLQSGQDGGRDRKRLNPLVPGWVERWEGIRAG